MGTVMGAAPGDHDALDSAFTSAARSAFAAIDAMPELEVSGLAGDVNIIRNGRAASGDGLSQHGLQMFVQCFESSTRNGRRSPARPDAGAMQRFIGIDIAHAPQQLLIEQGTL